MYIWSKVLDNCPGLLCCVVNIQGQLVYATKGYKYVASTFFGHQCEEGGTYPPLITELDKMLNGALMTACSGRNDVFEIAGHPKNWLVSTAPLMLEENKIYGAVIKLSQIDNPEEAKNNLGNIIVSNPDILESVPFKAGIVDIHGTFLAVNNFLASSVRSELQGRNIVEFIKPDKNSDVLNILLRRSGNFECLMYDITINENFYDDVHLAYLDEELNDEFRPQKGNLRRMKIHASPIVWNEKRWQSFVRR